MVIVAFGAHKQELVSSYADDTVQVRLVEMPWWMHNQHMTIAVRDAVPFKQSGLSDDSARCQ